MRWLAIAMIAGLLVACGSDSDAAEDVPEAALEALMGHLIKGQGGPAYDSLHPAQQSLVSRDVYIGCSEGAGFELKDIEVLESYEDEIGIPGTDERAEATAMTFRITGEANGREDSFTDTMHMVDVGGSWRWMVGDPQPYIDGRCP